MNEQSGESKQNEMRGEGIDESEMEHGETDIRMKLTKRRMEFIQRQGET